MNPDQLEEIFELRAERDALKIQNAELIRLVDIGASTLSDISNSVGLTIGGIRRLAKKRYEEIRAKEIAEEQAAKP